MARRPARQRAALKKQLSFMEKKFLTIFLLLTFYFSLPIFVSAQFNLGNLNSGGLSSLSDELSVDLIPTYPKPNAQVYVNLRMYTEDLNSAMISWLLNGKVEKEGRGLTSFNFRTADAGSKTTITINIKLQNGINFSKLITINPATVDLLWQSNSFVPPFYKGKALFPPQGEVLISAIPQFNSLNSQIDPGRLIYKWTAEGEVLEGQSGYGKNTIRLTGPILGTAINVEVLVTDPTSNLVAENFITINPINPLIVFYENNPLYGIVFEHSINGGLNLKGEEVSIVVAPFFMNIRDPVSYSWSMNGKYSPDVSGLSATFRRPEGISGSTFLSLKAENQGRILQFAEGGFRINYKE